MAADGFSRSLPSVLAYEGGKVDNPKDPGGRTNQGVTQKVYDSYRRSAKKPTQDVYKMTAAERDAIYKRQYWDVVQGDKLPAGVDFVVFDGAVNSGPSQSVKWLQRSIGVTADGILGLITLDAVARIDDIDELVDQIVNRREDFLRSLKTFKTFGKGWISRTTKVRQLGKAWAAGAPMPALPKKTKEPAHASAKASEQDAVSPPGKGIADAATGAGVGAAGVGGALQSLQEQLTPFSSAGGWIGRLVVILIIIGAILTIGGLAWRWWANRRKKEMVEALNAPAVEIEV